MERTEGGRAQRWALAASFQCRSVDRRRLAHTQRPAAYRRGRTSPVVRFRIRLRSGESVRSLLSFPPQPGNEPLGKHDGDDRPAEARRDRRGRAGGDHDARRPDHGGAARAQYLPGACPVVDRPGERTHSTGGLGARRVGRDGHADRLRQSLEPPPRQNDFSPERTRDPQRARRRTQPPGLADADRKPRAVVAWRDRRRRARDRRHARAHPARRHQHPHAARRADRRHGARVYDAARHPCRIGVRLDPRHLRSQRRAPRLVEGRDTRLDGRARAEMGAKHARRVGDRVRVRVARWGRAPDPQPGPGARREHGIRAITRRDDPRRPRQPLYDAGTTGCLHRRRAPTGEGDSGYRSRGHYRCAAAWKEPYLGCPREGRHLRARARTHGLRSHGDRWLPRGVGHPVASRAGHRPERRPRQ